MTRTQKTITAWVLILCWGIAATSAYIFRVSPLLLVGGGIVLGVLLAWNGLYLFPFKYPREAP